MRTMKKGSGWLPTTREHHLHSNKFGKNVVNFTTLSHVLCSCIVSDDPCNIRVWHEDEFVERPVLDTTRKKNRRSQEGPLGAS